MNDEGKFSFGTPKSETDLSAQSQSQPPPSTSSPTPPSVTPSAQPGSRPGAWQPPTSEELQEQIPQYKVLGLLGRGGMGAVYQGWQITLERYVAIKILAPQTDDIAEAEFTERFKREARTMAKFQHPGIVSIFNAGHTPSGLLFIVMEYIEGTDVAQMLKAQGTLAPAHALAITAHVCDALSYAHEHGVIHRDIKPANIMINREGQVKVADFGLAKAATHEGGGLTRASMAMGTPDYIAPEALIAGIALDGRADLYAMGVMLYQMLTGRVPRGHFDMPSKRVPGVDPRFDGIVLKSMQEDREHRYQSAREIRQDLDVILTTAPESAEEPQAVHQKPVMRRAGELPRKSSSGAKTSKAGRDDGDIRRAQVESAPRNSGITFVFVLLGAALALGAIFAFKKWSAQSSERSGDTSNDTAPVTEQATFSPWRPLFTDAEWKETSPGKRELVDGRVHLLGPGVIKPQPSSDGAIRARIQYQQGSKYVGFETRKTTTNGFYKAELNAQGSGVVLSYFPPGVTGGGVNQRLGVHNLPKPLQPGDTLLLELRLQGERLTVLVDGAVAIESSDSRCTGPGDWGIIAADGWFESAEVQSAPAPTTGMSLLLVKATKDAPFVNSLGMKFVPVPILGGPTAGKTVLFSVWHTRVQDYELFATETKRAWPKPPFEQGPAHPAVNVNWNDVTAFCVWLTERDRKAGMLGANERYRLPGDHEWSCAGGIGDREDASLMPDAKSEKLAAVYPWGSAWPPPKGTGNYAGEEFQPSVAARKYAQYLDVIAGYRDDFVETSPVGIFPVNRLGLYDMSGNVWQWCEDWYDKTQKERVLRGASWTNARGELLSSHRHHRAPDSRAISRGFRCVLEVLAPAAAVTPAEATKERPYANTLGMKFVPVPIIGGPTAGKTVLFSVWETRVQDYEVFATETKRAWKKPDFEQGPTHPAVMVSWEDATAFCAWLTNRERNARRFGPQDIYRLPSDHEWSCAVGIGEREDAAKTPKEKNGMITDAFPWGSTWPPPANAGNIAGRELQPLVSAGKYSWINAVLPNYEDGFAYTSPVGSFPANRFGLYDMSGNVWELCEDWFDDKQKEHARRGGSWGNHENTRLLSSQRATAAPGNSSHDIGPRIVLVLSARTSAAVAPQAEGK